MPSVNERVYPDEMDTSREIQRILKEVFMRRYSLARDWIKSCFGDKEARVLDIACGSGYGGPILAELGEVVGVDIDPESISYANEHYASDKVQFLEGDAHDPEFKKRLGRFDAVMSSGTIEHLDDPEAFLAWIRSVLNPDGVCVLAFPATFTKDWAWPFHKWDIRPSKARKLIAEAGFEIKDHLVDGHYMKLRDLRHEVRTNRDIPAPPLSHWIAYYLTHPHHFAVRLYQITIGKGVLFCDQQYLLTMKD